MKYWLLTTEYPPLYGGGISTYCEHTANLLSEKGHSVTVFIPDERVKDHTIRMHGSIRVIRFSDSRTSAGDDLGHLARLSYAFASITRDIIRQEGKPDCIESQEYLAIPYYILQFKLLKYPEWQGIPILLTLHSPAFLYLLYNREGVYQFPHFWIGEMEKSCIRCADLVISPSHYMIDEIKKHAFIDDPKITVIRNPYQFTSPATGQGSITRNKIVFFGKLSPQKGVFELFSYLKDLWDNGFPHAITVIGGMDKVYYPEMKTMGQLIHAKYESYIRKGLVHFTGKIPPGKRDEYLSDAHVILIPSLNDNLPYSAIEAMSLGKVILASRQGGQGELITDGINGFLFDHARPAGFGEQLHRILSLDDGTLRGIGQAAAREIRETLNYASVYHQKMEAIRRIPPAGPENAGTLFPFTRPVPSPANMPMPSPEAQQVPGLLSVVIPYFNMGRYVRECIDSVLKSDYPDIEILVINDGSTDPVSMTALDALLKFPTVRIIHKKNEGLADTRNHGARLARGAFLAFLDADDRVDPDYYSRAIPVLEHYTNVAFVGAWVRYFGKKTFSWPTWNPEPPFILLHNSINSSGLVYKTSAFLSGGLNDKSVDYGLEDYESVISMLKQGYRGVALPECLFYYRIRKGSMYRALTRHKILYSCQYISEKHADFYGMFASEIFNLLNANGPSFSYDNPSLDVHAGNRNIHLQRLIDRLKRRVKKNPALKKILLKIAGGLKSR